MTLTCSHGGVKVKMKYTLHIYIVPQLIGIIIGEIGRVVSEEKRTQTTTRQAFTFTKSKYFVILTCSHGGVNVKLKCTLHIYIVPSVDWYNHWRNRASSFGGEANTNYYPSANIICDERMEGRTNGRTEGRTRWLLYGRPWSISSPKSCMQEIKKSYETTFEEIGKKYQNSKILPFSDLFDFQKWLFEWFNRISSFDSSLVPSLLSDIFWEIASK